MYSDGVSIVICCYNSSERLPSTLAHIVCQTISQTINWEVILVDNASTDFTSDVARAHWPEDAPVPLRVVRENEPGLSYARRRGFREARYEYVSFIDDDNWISPNWVTGVFHMMEEHPEVGACGGRTTPVFETDPPESFKQFQRPLAIGEQFGKEGDVTDTRGWLWGAGLTIRHSAWNQIEQMGWQSLLVGRKGSQLSSGEDNEICYWLRMLGWRLYYSPDLQLQHYIPQYRTDWNYILRLVRSNGRTALVDSAYKRVLSDNGRLRKRSFIRLWLSDFRANLTSFLQMYQAIRHEKKVQDSTYNEQRYLLTRRIAMLRNLMLIGPLGYKKLYGKILTYHSDSVR